MNLEKKYVKNAANNLTIVCRTVLGEISQNLQNDSLYKITKFGLFYLTLSHSVFCNVGLLSFGLLSFGLLSRRSFVIRSFVATPEIGP